MWKPYLKLLKHCTNALNILDRFHIVVKMNLALDKVPASEASRMAAAGYEPVLTKSRGSDRTNACLNLAFRLVTITHHQGAPLFVLTTLELLQQLAQLCLQGLRDQRPGTVAQQLGQLIPSSLSTGKIDHVILFHSGVSHQLVWLCRNSHFNQIRRYPSTRPNTTFDHSSIVECHGLTGELLNF
jgi:hypothetical protein